MAKCNRLTSLPFKGLSIYGCTRWPMITNVQYSLLTTWSLVAVLGLSVWGAVRGHGFGLGAFNGNNYRFPTTIHTMQVFGSDA